MRRAGVCAALALGIALAGCDTAARLGVIRKDILSDAQQAIQAMQINHGDMTIVGKVDREDTEYASGQQIVLSATLSKNGYVAILRVLPNGATTLVFPTSFQPGGAVAANQSVTVPAPNDPVTLVAGKPGIELFEFIASTDAKSWLFTRKPKQGQDFADLGVTTRAIARGIIASLDIGDQRDTVATYLTIRVR
jgi:hypothetical protein